MTFGKLWDTEDVSDEMMGVLHKYNKMSLDLKQEHKVEILEREDF